jgi:hypothetical protein
MIRRSVAVVSIITTDEQHFLKETRMVDFTISHNTMRVWLSSDFTFPLWTSVRQHGKDFNIDSNCLVEIGHIKIHY